MTIRPTQPATVTTTRTRAPKQFEDIEEFGEHPARGRFNSAFFWVMGGYINWHMHKRKSTAFADLPPTVVELGAGVGANMRYLPVDAPGGGTVEDRRWLQCRQADGGVLMLRLRQP